ncbi:hypothetical protein MRX96_048598 [Rhipicephalus microplus]
MSYFTKEGIERQTFEVIAVSSRARNNFTTAFSACYGTATWPGFGEEKARDASGANQEEKTDLSSGLFHSYCQEKQSDGSPFPFQADSTHRSRDMMLRVPRRLPHGPRGLWVWPDASSTESGDRRKSAAGYFDELARNHLRTVFLVIVLLSLGTRLYKITEPDHVCWDETRTLARWAAGTSIAHSSLTFTLLWARCSLHLPAS